MVPSLEPSLSLFNLQFFAGTQKQFTSFLKKHLTSKGPLVTVCTPNPEQIVQAQEDSHFSKALQTADVCIPDGIGIVRASQIFKLLGKTSGTLSERITGVAVVRELLLSGASMLVIGGRAYSSHHLANPQNLPLFHLRFPLDGVQDDDQPWYWMEGYAQTKIPTQTEEEYISAALQLVKPQVVCVAFGAPFQEQWLAAHRTELEDASVSVAVCVGGAFDFLTGKVARAPQLMQSIGLEWLFRLWKEPWRWKRQLRLLKFIRLVISNL
ncbi:WecB/TagA/CpsF family glycosyltransferase [Candidatus Woesebacteria bacterium]|nr:WecB/TagA/CpsF family glycosyltransferase [Candidatus Woesebacteria bacterium]